MSAHRTRSRALGSPVTRRRFLQGTIATGAALPMLTSATTAWSQPGPAGHTLVVVFLRGGMDGLSAVPPVGDSRYHDVRPTIAVPDTEALALSDGFGLHPAMVALHPQWQAGNLAIVHAVGSDADSRSHFDQQDRLERGGNGATSGWLTRHLLSRPEGAPSLLDAVAIAGQPPTSLAGPSMATATEWFSNFTLEGWWGSRLPIARSSLEAMYGAADPLLAEATATAFSAIDQVAAADPGSYSPTVSYPGTGFARGLREIASLVRSGLAPDVAAVDLFGWDTHRAMGTWQSGAMADKLAVLAGGLAAFADDLGPDMDNVTIVVQTEFGRRVAENANKGCDHGRGSAMFVLGNRVEGGIHGDWPTLDDAALDDGDVAVANDYRDVLGELVVDVLGNPDVAAVFPGHTYQPLGIIT